MQWSLVKQTLMTPDILKGKQFCPASLWHYETTIREIKSCYVRPEYLHTTLNTKSPYKPQLGWSEVDSWVSHSTYYRKFSCFYWVTSWITKTHSHLIYLRHQSLSLAEWVDFPDAFLTELKSVCRTQTSPHTHCTTLVHSGSRHWVRLLPTHACLPASLHFPESQPTHLTQAGTGQMEISWLLAASSKVYPYTEG